MTALKLFIIICILVSCNDNSQQKNPGESATKSQASKPDTFKVNETFKISLGRGSGFRGLNVVEINDKANVMLYRRSSVRKTAQVKFDKNNIKQISRFLSKGGKIQVDDKKNLHVTVNLFWEESTLKITKESLREIIHLLNQLDLINLKETYSNPKVMDGSQWILRLTQGEKDKAIYFNNNFPVQIKTFAEKLDKILNNNGLKTLKWTAVPYENSGKHDDALWMSISPRKNQKPKPKISSP